jgi:hypothetical protein
MEKGNSNSNSSCSNGGNSSDIDNNCDSSSNSSNGGNSSDIDSNCHNSKRGCSCRSNDSTPSQLTAL